MMHEYLLWNNCNNNCRFCWQKKLNDQRCHLDEDEMIASITDAIDLIRKIDDGGDVLIVGGEVFAPVSTRVSGELAMLFSVVAERVKAGELRFFYVNTNLLYDDLNLIIRLYNIFQGVRDRIKFTTSYDVEGRYACLGDRELVERNLRKLRQECPELNIVVNSIMTPAFCDAYLSGEEVGNKAFKEKYGVKYVNMLPYIPIREDDAVSFGKVVRCLEKAEKDEPGFIMRYVQDYDYNQDKILWEYHKGSGFEECTAAYAPCGHNVNFRKVFPNGRCYICEIKEYLNERQ